jgi:hypothetical protein
MNATTIILELDHINSSSPHNLWSWEDSDRSSVRAMLTWQSSTVHLVYHRPGARACRWEEHGISFHILVGEGMRGKGSPSGALGKDYCM